MSDTPVYETALGISVGDKVRWLKDHAPMLCGCCSRVFFSKDAQYELSNLGMEACLCPKCHTELFHPFTGGQHE